MKKGYRHKSKWIVMFFFCISLFALTGITIYSFVLSKEKNVEKTQLIPQDDSVYCDAEGNPVYDKWIRAGERSFYAGSDGRLIRDRIVTLEGKNYGFAADGQLIVSENFIKDGSIYHSADDGSLSIATGWQEVDGKTYYADTDGTLFCDRKIRENGKEFCLDKNGVLLKDRIVIFGEHVYQADPEGVLSDARGWVQSDGSWYFADTGGKLKKNCRTEKDGVTCFLALDGHMVCSDFYTYENELYFADQNGASRKQDGWFHWKDRWYYSDSDGRFLRDQYVDSETGKCYLDHTGARIIGKPTIDQYLKCNDILGWMTSHHTDYYFKTRYRGLIGNEGQPEVLIRPFGEYGARQCGMNCTGFIASLVYYSGGDLDRVSAMGNYGKYANADNFLKLGTRDIVECDTFPSVQAMLESGKVHKGDILYLSPVWRTGADCHMGVFWGDTPGDDQFWSQTLAAKCSVTKIFMVDPIAKIYRFPISANRETVYYTGSTP